MSDYVVIVELDVYFSQGMTYMSVDVLYVPFFTVLTYYFT